MQIHDKDRPPPAPRKRSCARCCKSKIKCSGDYPTCVACLKRSVPCAYENALPKGVRGQSNRQLSTLDSISPFDTTASEMNFQSEATCDSMNGNGLLSPQSSLEISRAESHGSALYSSMDLSGVHDSGSQPENMFAGAFGFETFGYSDLSDGLQNSSLDWMFRSALDSNFAVSFPNTPGQNLIDPQNLNQTEGFPEQQTARNLRSLPEFSESDSQ
ncbi:hypothetical protein DH86_00001443, partial [Scytalidium sp. 3C]